MTMLSDAAPDFANVAGNAFFCGVPNRARGGANDYSRTSATLPD